MKLLRSPVNRRAIYAIAAAIAVTTGCSGGDKGSADSAATAPAPAPASLPTSTEAARFLGQATFGATAAEIDRVTQIGFDAWLTEQFAIARTDGQARVSHLDFVTQTIPLPIPPNTQVSADPLYFSFWRQAMTYPDQLRQRVTFALSEILVTSTADAALNNQPHQIASYLDMLSANAFGNYRELLEAAAKHPAMGQYLTALGNRADGGRVPDENFAREVMQLFSIGLFELNMDGTPKMANGAPVETYGIDDIRGLAKVFTGWSWGNVGTPDPSNGRFNGNPADPQRRVIPMQFYAQYHSPDAKVFLSANIPSGTAGTQAFKVALDTLFNHPNNAPFISKSLIQRLVTSNPSAAYVQRVAGVFVNNGNGVRGDLKAVVRAILLDPEARDMSNVTAPDFGKLREPVLRLAGVIRGFDGASQSGNYRIGDLDNTFFQTPMRAPTVFNFFRAGFVPSNGEIAARGLVAPEFQIAHEVSVAQYANAMQGVVANGIGAAASGQQGNDVRIGFTKAVALAADPDKLVDHVGLILAAGRLSPTTRAAIRDAVIAIPATANNAALDRARLAVLMTALSSDYLIQK